MIAFRNDLPLIQLEDHRAVAFEPQWLMHCLDCAARKAGYKQWWLIEHVTESVTLHLRTQSDVRVLDRAQLEGAVHSVLQVIGYSEVGRHFCLAPPAAVISILELAHQAGSGYELAFFDLLARRIQDAVLQHASHFQIHALEPGVKALRSRKIWSRECDLLRMEIVAFAREQAGLAAGDQEVLFSLA